MPASYMIRAMGSAQEDFDVFFRNSIVAVGWSRVDFAAFGSLDELVEAVEYEYYGDGGAAPQVVGKKKNEVRRFKGIHEGDRIVVPYWSSVRLAVAGEEERFSAHDGEVRDLGNQHLVSFVRDVSGGYLTVPREQLSEGLQRRLRVRGSTVANLAEFEEEVGRLFHGEAYTSTIARVQNEQEQLFKSKLLAILQDGASALRAGGIGLENLVTELLRADGYVAAVQAKNRFPDIADADIEATRDDHVTSTRLLVQVKHHSGETDEWGATQLAHILEAEPDLFAEYRLVLVTSGIPSDSLQALCVAKDITLITGTQLVDWIMDSLEHLAPETKNRLRISDVPQLVEGKPTSEWS
jgi:restriction system protein